MVGREEAVMASLIAFMALLLLILLSMPSQRFVESLDAAVERAGSVFSDSTSTSKSTSTTSTTSTSTTTSSTTSTTTTSSTSTSTQSTTSTTTTTYPGLRCGSEADCPGVVEEYRCKVNTVYLYRTTYTCRDRGTPQSHCLGKIRSMPVEKCQLYEDCVGGRCVRLYRNECDYACDMQGYDRHYCAQTGCATDDVMLQSTECSGGLCCCGIGY